MGFRTLASTDDQLPERAGRQTPSVRYLFAEGGFAVGASLSFLAAYSFWVEVQTRPATPASMMPLYAPGAGCVAFLWGLIGLLWRDRREPPLSGSGLRCLLIGLATTLAGVLWPQLWR